MDDIIAEVAATGVSMESITRTIAEFKMDSVSMHQEWQSILLINYLLLNKPHHSRLAYYFPQLSIDTFKLLTIFLLSWKRGETELSISFKSALTKEESELLFGTMKHNNNYIAIHDPHIGFVQIPQHYGFKIFFNGEHVNPKHSNYALAEYIANNAKIKKVVFTGYLNTDAESLQLLFNAIQRNKSINTIKCASKISYNIAKAVLDEFIHSTTLKKLSMFIIPNNIGSFLAQNTSVKHLVCNLISSAEYFTMDNINGLVEGLKQNSTLTSLQLAYGGIDDDKFMKLLEAWSNGSKIGLKFLELAGNFISLDAFKKALNVWDKLPQLTLQTIDVRNNFETYEADRQFIAEWMQQHPWIDQITYSNALHSYRKSMMQMRNECMIRVLIIAQTLFRSSFISLIQEESLVPIILYYCQQNINDNVESTQDVVKIDENVLITLSQVNRIWEYTVRSGSCTRREFIEFVMLPKS